MMCNRCDIMKIMWHKTQMAQESDRMTEKGEGGGESWDLEYRFMEEKKKGGGGSDLGKGRRLPVPNIPGDEWENRSTQKKKNH